MTELIQRITDYWNVRPCNIRHSKQAVGTFRYFEEVDRKRYFVEPHIPKFCEFYKWEGKKVLELGCGIGTDAVRFARAGAVMTLTDISGVSIDIAKTRFEVYGLHGKFYVCNLEELSKHVPVEKYDLIYSFGVIHHTECPEKVIEEIKKYCHPNTVIKIMLYSKFSWKALSFFLTDGYKFKFNFSKTSQYFSEAQLDCPVSNTYTASSIRNLFKDFKIVSAHKDHIFIYDIPYYIQGKYKKTLIFRYMPSFMFNWFKRYFGLHYLIELRIGEVK